MSDYVPKPLDTSNVALPASLQKLERLLAVNTHEVWAAQRLRDGWVYGPERDDQAKTHPCLVPFDDLPIGEQEYDRNTSRESLRLIVALGYRIEEPGESDSV